MPENPTRTISWGIIGCGDVTELKSGPAYQKTQGFELTGVTRRDLAKAEDYAARHGVPRVFASATELIESPDIDAVYIATPPDSHKQYALEVAAAGKPCCIEKPMAPTYQDCLEILAAFEANTTPVYVAYYRRTLPRFLQVKKWIDDGAIGKVRHVHWQYSKPPSEIDLSDNYNWRTDAKIAKGGHFDDLASHGFNLFCYLLGDVKSASGICANQLGLYSAYDSISSNWIHESGVTGTGFLNFGSFEHVDQVEILGSEGRIHFPVFAEQPITLASASDSQSLEIKHPENVQLHHVEALRDDLFGIRTHPSLGATGAHTNWILDEILKS
ncbi:Gfo/Idh/MocA family protein [Pelagicoccus mobilis]|uniref:Gfo/Idh/MocA family oxidoreductase n=1 Tax=Pelagicoccus mobilis TaxID=415221 RepID=A0A934VQ33_9BACT|nr:Gfo/Idh/MocA family oxidoreductase [Pelagicoccus mobilis]MBK1876470.1 Gfo/Idh/MocA family oxidoreductase [Pelagicoccus mobilis]